MKETAINDNSMYSVKSKNIATMEYMAKTAVKMRKHCRCTCIYTVTWPTVGKV